MQFFVSLDHTLTLTSLFRSNMLPLSPHFHCIVESKISRPARKILPILPIVFFYISEVCPLVEKTWLGHWTYILCSDKLFNCIVCQNVCDELCYVRMVYIRYVIILLQFIEANQSHRTSRESL